MAGLKTIPLTHTADGLHVQLRNEEAEDVVKLFGRGILVKSAGDVSRLGTQQIGVAQMIDRKTVKTWMV